MPAAVSSQARAEGRASRSRGRSATAGSRRAATAKAIVNSAWASDAQKIGLSQDEFIGILGAVAGKYLAANASEKDATTFLSGLRIQELILARACSAGNEAAWELFLTKFREPLYNAGRAIAKDDATVIPAE